MPVSAEFLPSNITLVFSDIDDVRDVQDGMIALIGRAGGAFIRDGNAGEAVVLNFGTVTHIELAEGRDVEEIALAPGRTFEVAWAQFFKG